MKTTLYKYFPLSNEKHLNRVIECLKGKIHFSSPLTFNDPFELQTIISPPTFDEVQTFLHEAGASINKKPKSFKARIHKEINGQFLRSPPTIATRDWLDEIGILCLAESPRDLLMWSHYGSNHKGVCIGFSALEKPFLAAKPITYTDQRPIIPFGSYKTMKLMEAEKIFLHKSKEWAYESEWRCVKRTIKQDEKNFYLDTIKADPSKFDEIADLLTEQGGPGNYDFDNMAIKRIYFGCRIEEDAKNKIMKEIEKTQIHAKKRQLKIDPRHFQLVEERIKK